jgi:restriction system protein
VAHALVLSKFRTASKIKAMKSGKAENKFVRMYGPLLDYLREVGGESKASEAARNVADQVVTDPKERQRLNKSGGNAIENEVAWARNNLREAGLIDGSVRGIWKLTPTGWQTVLTLSEAVELGRHSKIIASKLASIDQAPDGFQEDNAEGSVSLIETIRALPPSGFERLCQRLLRELGFEEVQVTGKSGDGGLDGHGVLSVNELVSFRVYFQCKRYKGSVGPGDIRDFRGAMAGRTDKGIFLSTGSFSSEARREASRDGVPPVELVDADRLVELMEKKLIGVRPRTVYDVDLEFFKPFQSA